ncbi:putative zinc-binding oxidoreductase [Streptomyces lincolnensis]|nr:hypothetical protein [Streptomyces lincolnensis]AXG52059.1 putative zinc-binding oxidoreductase [Streptomyces lincolnensis]
MLLPGTWSAEVMANRVKGHSVDARTACHRVQPRLPLGLNRGQAECVVVPPQLIAAAPTGVDPVHTATIPLNGLTAAQSVELLGIQAGQSVLITGAEGAVGGYAVQLAKRRGAVVIASDLSPDGEFATKAAGGDVYVSASQPLVEAVRRVRPEGGDAFLDTARLGQALVGAVVDGGRFVATRIDALPQAERGIQVLLTQVGPDAAMLTTLSDLAATGDLAGPRVGSRGASSSPSGRGGRGRSRQR